MHDPQATQQQAGFSLIEVVVALAVVATVVMAYLGIRTNAVADGIEARNWRLAREIAEERMSEVMAGAHEVPPQTGVDISLADRYEGFHYRIYIGETAVSEMESEIAGAQSGTAGERSEWQRNRDLYRKASGQGMTAIEYEEQIAQDEYERELEDRVPSDGEFEEVAVVVFFPKLNGFDGEEETFVIKARASTLAISGMTADQAQMVAESRGEASGLGTDAAGSDGGGMPFGGGR